MKRRAKKVLSKPSYLTWAQVDLKAIQYNVKQLQALAVRNTFVFNNRPQPKRNLALPSEILAVIKAEAYGHGMKEVGLLLEKNGVGFFAVSDIPEGVALREAGIKNPILLFENTIPSEAKYILDYDLSATVCTLELAKELNRQAKAAGKVVDVHLEIDTGMGRLGIWHKQAVDFIRSLQSMHHLVIKSIYTHFPAADTDRAFTRKQLKSLNDLIRQLDKSGLVIPYIHAANSMGLAGFKTNILNLVRPGLMIYGLYPDKKLKKQFALKPALSVHSKVIFVKTISKGTSISYGRTFISKRKMKVATIPIGYSNGYPVCLSNKGVVLINGQRCPVVGRVTMDQIVVDVSKVKEVKVGQPVVILGTQKDETITADELAKQANTINYEIVCNLGNLLPRTFQ